MADGPEATQRRELNSDCVSWLRMAVDALHHIDDLRATSGIEARIFERAYMAAREQTMREIAEIFGYQLPDKLPSPAPPRIPR